MKKANELIKFLAHPIPIFPASKLLNRPASGIILRGTFGYEEWMVCAAAHLASESFHLSHQNSLKEKSLLWNTYSQYNKSL
jgi:hypothetical protein